MKGLLTAAAFLTRLPMPERVRGGEPSGASIPWFPVVGAGIGALVGGSVRAGAAVGLPPLAAAALGVGAGLAVTGAFHEDGLADAFDGLGSGRPRSQMLEIMHDPGLGTFGASALVISLLLQVSALAALPAGAVISVAAAAHSSSRTWPAAALALPLAASDGLAAAFRRTAGKWTPALGFVIGMAAAAALLRSAAWVLLPAGLAGALTAGWAVRRLGGINGDILGAVQQTTLAVTLVAASAVWSS